MADEKNVEEICPKIQQVDGELKNLSYEEKLQAFEKEANSLYAFCLKKGFSDEELLTCVSKLHGPAKPVSKQALNDSRGSLMFLSLLIALVACVYVSPAAQNMVAVHYKLATIKFVMPFWNFGALYNQDCLVSNVWLPEEEEPKKTKETCKFCSNIVELNNNTIDRVNDIAPKDILKHYIQNDQPVVVTDTAKDWTSIKKALTMDEISYLFQNDKFFATFMGSCVYETNVGFNETFYDFITAYVDKKLPKKWHASWENCDTKAAKVLRRYYKRPYYLPEMAQGTSFNTIIAAKGNHSDDVFTMTLEQNSGTWVAVISGLLKVYLSPHEDCLRNFGCKVAVITLGPGESVFYFPEKWIFEYTVVGEDMTIAVMSSLIWDKM